MRTLHRIALTITGLASLSVAGNQLYPRTYAWQQVSSAATIATQRAGSCVVTPLDIVPGALMYRPNSQGEAVLMNPGELVCNPKTGVTAEVSAVGIAQHIRGTTPEILQKTLKERFAVQQQGG